MRVRSFTASEVYAVFTLSCGLGLCFWNPPGQVPDEMNHFYRAISISEGQLIGAKVGGKSGGVIPRSVPQVAEPAWPQMIAHRGRYDPELYRALGRIRLSPQDRVFMHFPNTVLYSPMAYLPQVLGIWAGRLGGAGALALMYAGRVGALLGSGLVTWLAIRRLPGMSWLFCVFALSPMAIYQTASLSADSFTNALCFLWVASLLKMASPRSGESVSPSRSLSVTYVLAGVGVGLCKIAYLPLGFLILLAADRKGGRRRARRLLFLGLGGAGLAALAWLWCSRGIRVSPRYDGEPTDPSLQFRYVFSHPLAFALGFLQELKQEGREICRQYIGVLGWLDTALPVAFYRAYLAGVGLVVASSLKESPLVGFRPALVTGAAALSALILTVLLIYANSQPVGGPVAGLQGRYLIPIVPVAIFAATALVPTKWREKAYAPVFAKCMALGIIVSSLAVTYWALWRRFY